MKTDNELNRLITKRVLNEPLEPPCGYYHETDAAQRSEDGWSGWCYNCDCSISEVAPEARRYCTDPAAWGALFVWLANPADRGLSPEIGRTTNTYYSTMFAIQTGLRVEAYDTTYPGRALVLATLAAYGVTEVE